MELTLKLINARKYSYGTFTAELCPMMVLIDLSSIESSESTELLTESIITELFLAKAVPIGAF